MKILVGPTVKSVSEETIDFKHMDTAFLITQCMFLSLHNKERNVAFHCFSLGQELLYK